MMNYKDRGSQGVCLCCGGVIKSWSTLTSAFLSMRSWGGAVERSHTYRCSTCGFAFHGRGLSDAEVSTYYQSYRDEQYFIDRNSHEPFYTRRVHDELETKMGGAARRKALASYLSTFGVLTGADQGNFSTLDYAGGTGRLIADLPGRKSVYDVSGEAPALGIEPVTALDLTKMKFDLVICAQMIEHATDPKKVMTTLIDLVRPGGHLYIEVPFNETWRDWSCPGVFRDAVLEIAVKHRWFNVALDIYGTAFRVKLKVLPPLAFVPVREHLNYFTPQSLVALGQTNGAVVLDASRVDHLGTTLIVRKPLN
jgi:SAM-dependent methyltransferase